MPAFCASHALQKPHLDLWTPFSIDLYMLLNDCLSRELVYYQPKLVFQNTLISQITHKKNVQAGSAIPWRNPSLFLLLQVHGVAVATVERHMSYHSPSHHLNKTEKKSLIKSLYEAKWLTAITGRVRLHSKILYSNFLFIRHEAEVGIWFYIAKTAIQAEICVAKCLKYGAFCSVIQSNSHPDYRHHFKTEIK